MILVATVHANDRAARKPLTFELRRTLWLESPTTMIVEVTRAGVLGGPSSTTRSIYRKGCEGTDVVRPETLSRGDAYELNPWFLSGVHILRRSH